jgi:rare lipoprotein A
MRIGVLAGAMGLTMTCAATVPAPTQADTQGTPVIYVGDRTAEAGQRVRVSGRAPGAAGRTVTLQQSADGGAGWTTLAEGTVGKADRFRFRTAVPRSGVLRATIGPPADGSAAYAAAGSTSNEAQVAVRRDVDVRHKRMHVTVGRATRVTGTVNPGTAGLPVKLQVRAGGRWKTLDRSATAAGGTYRLHDRVGSTLSAPARVVTAGADGLEGGDQRVGRLNVYRFAHVSWYGPGLYGGHLACGGTLQPGTLGVANKSLPCGAKVTLRHGGRSIRVRVIDRGPYVGGREYDLTAATAQRLGFHGHGSMRVTR